MVARGDVCWVELAEAGRRPVCVLTRDAALPVLREVLVAPVTRTARQISTEVPLDEEDGMPVACAITLDNIQIVPRVLLTETITSLSGTRMRDVCRALALATDCA